MGWALCFVMWNISSFLFMKNALVSSVSTGVIYFLVLYFLYNGNTREKLAFTIGVVIMGILAEGIAVLGLSIAGAAADEYLNPQAGLPPVADAFSKLIWFGFVKLVTRISLNQRKITGMDWLEIFLVPIGSVLICYVAWQGRWNTVDSGQVVAFGVLFVFNIATYYMYSGMREYELLKQQDASRSLYYEEFEKQWLKLRRMRHDMANYCALEMSYLKKGEYEQLMQHYQEKMGQIRQLGDVIHTGNIGIDSILNYKLEIAKESGIEVDKKIKIESEIKVRDIDMMILVGNLFDNAIEAVRELPPEERKIHFFIRTNAARLLLGMRNAYVGKRKRDPGGNFLTGKGDHLFHGLGLREAEEIVKKYDGEMRISDSGGEFFVKVFLYIKG